MTNLTNPTIQAKCKMSIDGVTKQGSDWLGDKKSLEILLLPKAPVAPRTRVLCDNPLIEEMGELVSEHRNVRQPSRQRSCTMNMIVIMMPIGFMAKIDEDHGVEMGELMTKDQDVRQPL